MHYIVYKILHVLESAEIIQGGQKQDILKCIILVYDELMTYKGVPYIKMFSTLPRVRLIY